MLKIRFINNFLNYDFNMDVLIICYFILIFNIENYIKFNVYIIVSNFGLK